MKKIYTFVAIFIFATSIFAQNVVLTYDYHSLSADKTNEMKLTKFVSPGNAGENQLWDFSGLEEVKDFQGYIKSSYEVDVENTFPESNVVLNEFGNKFYFKLDENTLEQYGMKSSNGKVAINYDRPYVKMKYPFAYGDNINGSYGGTYKSSSVEVTLDGTYEVEADGYGKLLLPGGVEVENTLRVKSKRTYTRNFSNPNTVEITTFRWYTDIERFPLLVLTTIKSTTNGKTYTSHQAAYRESVATSVPNSLVADFNVSVYPNPYENHFSIDYSIEKDADVLIELYDNSGKKLETLVNKNLQQGLHTFRYNAEENSLSKGIYFINYSIDGKLLTTEKIIQVR